MGNRVLYTTNVQMRFTADQKAFIEAKAARAGISEQQVVRDLVDAARKRAQRR